MNCIKEEKNIKKITKKEKKDYLLDFLDSKSRRRIFGFWEREEIGFSENKNIRTLGTNWRLYCLCIIYSAGSTTQRDGGVAGGHVLHLLCLSRCLIGRLLCSPLVFFSDP